MKKLLNTTVIALALITIFASASLATTSDDEYEFTVLDKDVVIDFPAPISHEDCNSYASFQNSIDLALDVLQYDGNITENECPHSDHAQNQRVERILAELGFEG